MSTTAPRLAPWDQAAPQEAAINTCQPHPVSTQFRFAMPGWHVWCGSVVENPGGTFSLFFSCWPEAQGHDGWVTHSQIWRAEGPHPWGPFNHPEVVLAAFGASSWDADNFHNVTVKQFGGRYFLYYTGNSGNGEWWVHRNNQRIGVAVASSPRGPWHRSRTPVLDVSPAAWDSLCVANPSVSGTPEGRIMMIYKGVTIGDLPYGSTILHGAAFADTPEGPFEKADTPLFHVPGSRFPFEDPHLWHTDGRYHCLMKDMVGLKGSYPRATLLFESEDGLNWRPNDYRLVATPHLETVDGRTVKVERLERPAYFLHAEKPCLSFAVKPEGEGLSFLVFVPGDIKHRAMRPREQGPWH